MDETKSTSRRVAWIIGLASAIITIVVGLLTVTYKQEADNLRTTAETHQATIINLRERLDAKIEELTNLTRELATSQTELRQKRGDVEEWKGQHRTTAERLEEKQERLEQQIAINAALDNNYKVLNRDYENARATIVEQNSRISALESEVHDLKSGGPCAENVKRLEQELASTHELQESCTRKLDECKNTKVDDYLGRITLERDQLKEMALARKDEFRPFLDQSTSRFGSDRKDYSKLTPSSINDLQNAGVFHCHKCFAFAGAGFRVFRCSAVNKNPEDGRFRWPPPQEPADLEPYVQLLRDFKEYLPFYEEAGLLIK